MIEHHYQSERYAMDMVSHTDAEPSGLDMANVSLVPGGLSPAQRQMREDMLKVRHLSDAARDELVTIVLSQTQSDIIFSVPQLTVVMDLARRAVSAGYAAAG